MIIKCTHNAGFFSCCNIRLDTAIKYFNNNETTAKIDSSEQFILYKPHHLFSTDITSHFFEEKDNTIEYTERIVISTDNREDQFSDYRLLNIESITPFIDKYFSPSKEILQIKEIMMRKYHIDANNCIAVYYRGTDKYIETPLAKFELFSDKINEIYTNTSINNKNKQILVQTDSTQFLEHVQQLYPNVIVFKENLTSSSNIGIHNERGGNSNYTDIKFLFATFLIMSSCETLICPSSNCSLWMTYYRGHKKNVYQYLIDNFLD